MKPSTLYQSNDKSPIETLAERGIYYITNEIIDDSLLEIQQDILVKHMDPNWVDDIQLVINSPGGLISEGSAFIDFLDWIRMDVRTVAMGTCASMGACLACCGTKGKRGVAPNTSIMIHGMQWGVYGNTNQVVAIGKEMLRDHERDVAFWIEHSKYTTKEQIEEIFLHGKNDVWMDAKEAINHGIFDYIIGGKINNNKKKTVKKKK